MGSTGFDALKSGNRRKLDNSLFSLPELNLPHCL